VKRRISFLVLLFVCTRLSANDVFCGTRNTAFLAGETITFTVYYSVIGLAINAGTAIFTNTLDNINGKPVYHVVGDGKTNPSYDWIFKVRDKYESYFDTATLQPLKFIRNIDEGGFRQTDNVTFNKQTNTAVTTAGVYNVPACVQDVLSSIYYARNIDYNSYKVNDKIPFDMFLDNKVYNLYIRYLGKEVIKTRFGKFNAIKFRPLLVKGTMFKGGEDMAVWVSDDPNHIPVRIESPIIVGNVKVDMMKYSNLRYPLSSLISK
jgi:hypothetical protein